jgi:hypothetical protein
MVMMSEAAVVRAAFASGVKAPEIVAEIILLMV